MPANVSPARGEDQTGARRLALGGGLGLAAGVLAIALPLVFLYIATYDPGGFFALGPTFFRYLSILLLAGAILFLLSLLLYRRSFAVLRAVDPRFRVASALCLVGSLGFLLLVVLAAYVLGSTDSLASCLQGAPSHALSCLRSNQPVGAYSGLVGFWLGWLGGLGIVLGLFFASRRFVLGTLSGGAVLYLLLLLVLVGPFLGALVTLPGAQFLLLVAPFFAVAAPALVLAGARRPIVAVRAG